MLGTWQTRNDNSYYHKVEGDSSWFKKQWRDFLAVQWLRLDLSMQEMRVPFPVGNLAPNIPHSQKTSTETAEVIVFNNRVTNSVKTVHIQKKKKNLKNKRSRGEALCFEPGLQMEAELYFSWALAALFLIAPLPLSLSLHASATLEAFLISPSVSTLSILSMFTALDLNFSWHAYPSPSCLAGIYCTSRLGLL